MQIKNSWSLAAFLLLAAAVIYSRFLLPRWLTYDWLSLISWDIFGYYLYLPATFIHHDVGLKDFTWMQSVLDTYKPTIGFYQAYMGPAGEYVMKYTMGLAILNAPFFFLAHWLAPLLGHPADGFSLPYQVSIAMGGLVYTVIGMWLFRKVLLRYLTDRITALTMAVIILGTNYFQLTAFDGPMPHNYLFTLYAFVIWLSVRWMEKPSWGVSAWLGLSLGMVALIRPSDVILAIVPLLWGVYNRETLVAKWKMIRQHSGKVVLTGALMFLAGFLQLIYWKLHAGRWLYYSYEEGEKIRLFAPYLLNVLFSFKKGWLIYAPLMTFAILGFILQYRRSRETFIPVFLFFLVNLLVISGWTTWWFGGSLGQRSMMQSYTLLALPMGFFIHWVTERRWVAKSFFMAIFLCGITLNLFQTWQYINFIFDPSRMTGPYYRAVFLKTHLDPGDLKLLEPLQDNVKEKMENVKGYSRRTILYQNFETPDPKEADNYIMSPVRSGKYAYRLDSAIQFSPGLNVPVSRISSHDFFWVSASAWVWPDSDSPETLGDLVITTTHAGKHIKYRSLVLEKSGLVANHWNHVTIEYEMPYISDRDEDLLRVYFWYRGKKQLFVDNLEIFVFEE